MKRIFYIFLILILGIIIFIWYAGAFEKITIIDQQDGPYIIAGLEHKGSYAEIGKKFETIKSTLADNKIETGRMLGIYYDKPGTIAEEDFRSFGAAIVEGENLNKLGTIAQTNLTVDTIPPSSSLYVDLPARSIFCYMIYPMKVYPAFDKFNAEKGYTASSFAYEVYDEANKKVRYVMPYSKQ